MMGVVARERASDAQRREEGLLRDLDAPDLLHPALARLLLLEQLALAGYVAAVTLGGYVLAVSPNRLAGDDPLSHGRLHRNLELLARDKLFQFFDERPAASISLVAVYDDRERVHEFARYQHLDLHQV